MEFPASIYLGRKNLCSGYFYEHIYQYLYYHVRRRTLITLKLKPVWSKGRGEAGYATTLAPVKAKRSNMKLIGYFLVMR